MFPEPVNLTTVFSIFKYADSVTEGYFSILIPISLFLIVFLYLKLDQHYTPDCMMAAGFITTIVSVFLRLVGLIQTKDLFWVIAVTVASAVWAMWSKKE